MRAHRDLLRSDSGFLVYHQPKADAYHNAAGCISGKPEGSAGQGRNKVINLRLIQEEGASFSFDKLLGYQAALERDDTRYLSSPLKAEDRDLTCTFSDVPSGTYKLKMDIFGLSAGMRILAKPVRTISLDMRIGRNITIAEALPVK
jgi:hypothetical protein